MKYYNKYKEKSLREESARCEKEIASLERFLTESRMNPTKEDIEDIMKDKNGFHRFIFDNKFNAYLNTVYGDVYVPDSKIDEERRPFTKIYNTGTYSTIYSFTARFNGVVSLKHVEGSKCTFAYDKDELDAFIEKSCRMEISDDVEIMLEYIKAYTKFLNVGRQFDPIRDAYITKSLNGVYSADTDKFVCDFVNK